MHEHRWAQKSSNVLLLRGAVEHWAQSEKNKYAVFPEEIMGHCFSVTNDNKFQNNNVYSYNGHVHITRGRQEYVNHCLH